MAERPSQDCDSAATSSRQRLHNVEDMKKTLATTAIAAALALSLSGCTFGLVGPAPKPPIAPAPIPQSNSEQEPAESTTEPVYGDDINCTDGESFELTNDNYDGGFLAITGNCADILVSANNVTLSFESVESLAVTGIYNTITIAGSLEALSVPGDANTINGASVGDMQIDGYSNTVTFDTASSVVVAGEENTVAWYGGAGSGTDSGVGNYLSAP